MKIIRKIVRKYDLNSEFFSFKLFIRINKFNSFMVYNFNWFDMLLIT